MPRKKILFISSRPIFPIKDGGQIRTAQQLELLTQNYDVDVIYLTDTQNYSRITDYLPVIKNEYNIIYSKNRSYLNTLKGLLGKLPLQVNYYYSGKLKKWIKKNINDYDAVFCNNIRTAEYVRKYKSIPKYLDFVDAISMNYMNARNFAKWPMSLIYNLDFHRCRRYEQICLKEFDQCAVISEVDKDYLSTVSETLHLVGNYINLPSEKHLCLHTEPRKIVFLGKMSYAPNILAVTNFAENIFPALRKRFPDIEFYIVGATPTKQIISLGEIPGVTVTGFVDSIEPYFKNATIVIAPMLTGAGIQNKIIQAMASGCCVATTPRGKEGLIIENEEIAILDSNKDWITGLTTLIEDPEKRREMGRKAREYVKNNLSKEHISSQFNKFMNL